MTVPKFTLRQLEVFVAVARTANVTRAGELLHLSPSATSAAIKELERAIDTDLCVRRKGRGVTLTPEGELLERLASQLLSDASEISHLLSEQNTGQLTGTFRLGYHMPLSTTFLPPLMERFAAEFPHVDIALVEGDDDELQKMLLDGVIDAALGYLESTHPDLHSVHVASRAPYVLVPLDHRFADRESVSLAELENDPLILITVGANDGRIMSWFEAAGVSPRVRWVTHEIDLTRALVGRGLGYTVLMQRQSHCFNFDGSEVKCLEIRPPVDPVKVFLVSHASNQLRRTSVLLNVAKDMCRTLPAWTGVSRA
ncbi:MAG: LysR family transcriptional regulator [Leucobacter sp.]